MHKIALIVANCRQFWNIIENCGRPVALKKPSQKTDYRLYYWCSFLFESLFETNYSLSQFKIL